MTQNLSRIEYIVLDLLRTGRNMYGLEMVKASEGALKRGTVYTTLNRMVDKGYLTSEAEKNPSDPGLPRRKYRITGKGQRILHATDMMQANLNGGAYV